MVPSPKGEARKRPLRAQARTLGGPSVHAKNVARPSSGRTIKSKIKEYPMRSHKLGKEGEAFAAEFLTARGYFILKVNYRTKVGEIDLVARDGDVVCFIEVKTRQDDGWDAFEAVDKRKQYKIRRVAQQFLIEEFKTEDVPARFDVLGIRSMQDGTLAGELLKDAFGI
jgi:putative endonuclease